MNLKVKFLKVYREDKVSNYLSIITQRFQNICLSSNNKIK